jgi:hypothetical protein
MSDDEALVQLSVRIPPALRKKIKLAGVDADIQVQEIVRQALEEWLIRHS